LPRSSLPRRWAHVVTNTGFRHVSLAHGSSRAGKGSGALRRDLSLRAISPAWPSKATSTSAASRSIQSPSRPCSLGERSSELEGGALTQGERRRRRACGQPLSDGGPACAAPDAAAGDELELPPSAASVSSVRECSSGSPMGRGRSGPRLGRGGLRSCGPSSRAARFVSILAATGTSSGDDLWSCRCEGRWLWSGRGFWRRLSDGVVRQQNNPQVMRGS
jgi:hypothetical protein